MKGVNPCAGFSLVEVMAAILIMGVALVGLTQGLTTALRSSKESEQQTAAVLIAAGQIETLRAEGYVLAGKWEGETVTGPGTYRWEQTVTETQIEGLYEVRVVVDSVNSRGPIYELRTLLFDPPISSGSSTADRGGRSSSRRRRGMR